MEDSFAREVFQQVNKLRRFPLTFVAFLEERRTLFKGTVLLGEQGAIQTCIHPGRPQTNGMVERVQRTILEECWRPSFARSLVPKMGGLVRDLEAYLRFYNEGWDKFLIKC